MRSIGAESNEKLKLSEFTVVHFDGEDEYWVDPEVGDVREYFKRLKSRQESPATAS